VGDFYPLENKKVHFSNPKGDFAVGMLYDRGKKNPGARSGKYFLIQERFYA